MKRIQQSDVPDMRFDRSKSDEFEVAKAEMEFPEESRVTFEDDSLDNPTMEDEKYVFKATLPLPKSLRDCRQDVDSHAINITHRFKLMVNIHNPEGHISQVSWTRKRRETIIDWDLACMSTAREIVHLPQSATR